MVFGLNDEFFRRTNVGPVMLHQNLNKGLAADRLAEWLINLTGSYFEECFTGKFINLFTS
jgi:hypothetical protein